MKTIFLRNVPEHIKDFLGQEAKEYRRYTAPHVLFILEDYVKLKTQKSRKAEIKIPDESFNEFWKAYPRKVNRPGAQKSWRRIPNSEHKDLLKVLEKQKTEWADPKFIPHPTTWLNQERWKSEEPEMGKPVELPDGTLVSYDTYIKEIKPNM